MTIFGLHIVFEAGPLKIAFFSSLSFTKCKGVRVQTGVRSRDK